MHSLQLIDDLLDLIDLDEPIVRPEVVRAARRRLEAGGGPSAHDLAGSLLIELVAEPRRPPDDRPVQRA